MGNEGYGVRQAVPAFTSPGESVQHVVSTTRMMRPPGIGQMSGQMTSGHGQAGHGPVGTYHPNRMMLPPGSHPGLVHPGPVLSQASGGGIMTHHHVTPSHPQLVGHHQTPPHRGHHPNDTEF